MRQLLRLLCCVLPAAAACASAPVHILGDFESGAWPGVAPSMEHVKQGERSGKWAGLKARASITVPGAPSDWSGYDRLTFWLYSERANGQRLTLVCNSEDKTKPGWDYFYHHMRVDWQGWKRMDLRLGKDIRPTRNPLGWDEISSFRISSSGWQHAPLPDTVLYFDDVKLVRDPVRAELAERTSVDLPHGGRAVTTVLAVTNRLDEPQRVTLDIVAATPEPRAYRVAEVHDRTPVIAPGQTARIPLRLEAAGKDLRSREPLVREAWRVVIEPGLAGSPALELTVSAAVPLPKREHPFLFGGEEAFARARGRASRHPWAKARVDAIVRTADRVLATQLTVPDEGGQWGHHYVCKKCGLGLRFKDGKHLCRKCGAEYTGWPYDQVRVARVHSGNWRAVEELGLAYEFTHNEAYARRAREILLAYAEKYRTLPIHNSRGRVSRSGGRAFAQTLDESVTIIRVAWGYDLIYRSPCLSPADRSAIEDGFLREVVKTIQRHDAGISNWQSWHNAGIAAVGFCIEDAEIASHAINGKSGLRFQLDHSVLPDGFWYEGTAAYHYYALNAIRYAAEAARFAGIDVYGHAALKSLFDAPLLYVFPDLRFPAVNDSDVFSIGGQHRLYEIAYARWHDPRFLPIARLGRRSSLEALLWGEELLPGGEETRLTSRDFPGLGAAVLRQGVGRDQMYVHLDYGAHGGGHGHPDKFTVILFALGSSLAPDPGRLAYAAPMHRSWYRQTIAHNTVCVDQASQRAATGKLTFFTAQPGLAVAQAECDSAYAGVTLARTLALTDRYLIDVFTVRSDRPHTYDWAWHNYGSLRTDLPTQPQPGPLGEAAGYQHVRDVQRADTDGVWSVDFEQPGANVRVTMLAQAGTALYFGVGLGRKMSPCPVVVARRRAKETTFVSVIEPYRDSPSVVGLRTLPVAGPSALGLEVRQAGGRDVLMVADAAGVERRIAGYSTTARTLLIRTNANGTLTGPAAQ